MSATFQATPVAPRTRGGADPEVAVIGGGISGLTAALRLAQGGAAVTLYEGSPNLGGLGTFFEHKGRPFEKFYHCLLPTDGPLLDLLTDLGLREEVYWKPTSFGYWHDGKVLPLNKPLDLLRFTPLDMVSRLRVGFTGAYGRSVSDKGLDDVTAVDWLTKLSGKRAFATFWRPMLEAKFGDRYQEVPALWFWSRFNREKGDQKGESKGYIRGGYKRIIEVLESKLRALNVEIRLSEPVVAVDLDARDRPVIVTEDGPRRYERLVVTSPWNVFQRSLGARLQALVPSQGADIDYQGVINNVLFLRRPLTPHYWVATPQEQFPFDGVIETSTLTEEADRGARHVVYLTKYLHRTDPRFHEPAETLEPRWWQALQELFPDLRDEDLEASHVFHAPFVEPIYTKGFLQKRPPEALVPGRIYLATTAQVYPTVTSWIGAVGQVQRTLEVMATAAQPVA
ncbi:MAG: FAD-dependent oxidoreductase [Roseimicrobium sp.]